MCVRPPANRTQVLRHPDCGGRHGAGGECAAAVTLSQRVCFEGGSAQTITSLCPVCGSCCHVRSMRSA